MNKPEEIAGTAPGNRESREDPPSQDLWESKGEAGRGRECKRHLYHRMSPRVNGQVAFCGYKYSQATVI